MANNDEITLQPKDGKKHMLFVELSSNKIIVNDIERIYTEKLDKITSAMQDKGYEIVDVRFTDPYGCYIRVLIIYQ